VFPPIMQDQDEMHSVWINLLLSSRDRNEDAREWALAHFALDNLVHRACHLAKRARQIRTSVMYSTLHEDSLQQEILSLQKSHENWKLRPIIQRTELTEMLSHDRQIRPAATDPFLYYPPLSITNKFYTSLHSHWDSIRIYISLISHPFISPLPERTKSAISICRAHAAMGARHNVASSGKVVWLIWAAVAFGQSRESEWIEDCLKDVRQVFPRLRGMVERFREVVEIQGEFWVGFGAILDALDNELDGG
jgi:hypothetical protein